MGLFAITVTVAGCPGTLCPAGLNPSVVAVPVAVTVIVKSSLPRPAKVPLTVSVVVPTVNVGLPGLKWTLAATATVAVNPKTTRVIRAIRRIAYLPSDTAAP
jgi:hypothetical protein